MNKEQLINFLLSKEIPENLEQKKEALIVNEILKHCWNTTPSNLYRYRFCNENSFNALENDKFLLTRPTLFNDPYDSLLFINKERILSTLTSKQNKDPNLIEKLKNDQNFRKVQIERFGEDFVNHFLKVNSFKNSGEENLYNHLSDKLNTNMVENLVDESIKSLKQSSLVGCLSENIDSILMWSHYAQNHQGFALNYDFKSRYSIDTGIPGIKATDFADKKLFPVRYTRDRYDATYYIEYQFIYNFYRQLGLDLHIPFYDKLFYYKILLFKSSSWSYEKEWRIIKQTNLDYKDQKLNIDFIENIKPKAIFLGVHISEENKKRLINIAIEKNIEIFQMKLNPFSKEYKLSSEILKT